MTKTYFTDIFRSPGIDRRNFIRTIGAGAAGAAMIGTGVSSFPNVAQAQTSPTLSKYTEQLPIPAVVNAKAGGTFSLPMASGLQRFHSALPLTPAWGYAGMPYLGPTFEVKRGIPITVTARNNLGAHPLAFAIDTTLHGAVEADKTTPRTTVHLHGGNTEAGSDGHPEATFLPGRRFDYH
jgi:FtsP/CotA-like multicopper oxidase with cupredoxin domain